MTTKIRSDELLELVNTAFVQARDYVRIAEEGVEKKHALELRGQLHTALATATRLLAATRDHEDVS